MDSPQLTATAPRRLPRPGWAPRPGLVATSLADLHGPTDGTVELPLWLFWSLPDRTFDLSDPEMRQWLYEIVLREASRLEDLAAYLDHDTLIALWPRLYLSESVRQAWEERHPVLRAAATAAVAAA
jgi:hypothetical protein